MPFSMPTTYFSSANAGYGSQFFIGSPLQAISEVRSFTCDLITMPEISTTHLLSPNNTEEFIPGMIKPGKCSFTGNFIGTDSQLQITTLAQTQLIFNFQIAAPVQRLSKTYTLNAQGFITSYKPGPFENNRAIEFSAEIQMTGAYTETVA